tara:strand:+ start:874 stop:1482 length:609 start_codon:yes stop_codon:yes gene_type:complete
MLFGGEDKGRNKGDHLVSFYYAYKQLSMENIMSLISKTFGTLSGHATSHRLSQEVVDLIDANIGEPAKGFHLDCFVLPEAGFAGLENDLFGPSQGDEIVSRDETTMQVRRFYKDGQLVDRDGTTPIVNREPKPATYVAVIWAFGLPWCQEKPALITAYGHGSSSVAAKEPWDKTIEPGSEEHQQALAFWNTHGISHRSVIMS